MPALRPDRRLGPPLGPGADPFRRRRSRPVRPVLSAPAQPSLLNNRGFTSGLILGLVFYAAVAGLLFVLSLFLQDGLHRTPTQASLGFAS
ncbi:hypothetical protein ACFXJ8_18175 [Nonomuraea sp. NPDC059194]|uniref:hypothetical protein n=1 Tax=Nonomuraea sp. NPDC059194 TaxID=3346764 RepID=UPI0036904018